MDLYYILVRIVVRLEVLGDLLVLVVRTIVRVFLQMYMDCLENRYVLMFGGYLFDYLLVLLDVLGCCWWGLVWGLLISNFEKF